MDFIVKFYVQQELNFEIISYGNSSKIVDGVCELNKNRFLTNVKVISDVDKWEHKFNQSAVVFTKNFNLAVKFFDKIKFSNLHPNKIWILIYIENLRSPKKLNYFNKYLHLYFYNEHPVHFSYFLINSGRQLQLFTIEWFTKFACDQFQIVLKDIFDGKWKNSLGFEEKFKNFHNCMIVMYAYTFARKTRHKNNYFFIDEFTNEMTGSVAEFSKAVGKKGEENLFFLRISFMSEFKY